MRRFGIFVIASAVILVLGASAASAQTGVLFVQNDKVGVGIDTPVEKLHVKGPTGDAAVVRIDGAGGEQVEASFWDGSALSGRLIGAMGNTVGSRYFGFLSYQDKDGARVPIRFFTQDAGGTLRQSIFLNAGQPAGQPGWLGVGRSPLYPIHAYNNAYLSVGGVWTNASSREFKTDIHELSATQALEALSGMQPVLFRYKADESEEYAGFIAEDVPDLVATSDRRGLSAMDIVAVLTKVVQQQEERIAELERLLDLQQSK